MLDSLTVSYIQFVIMVIELKKSVLSGTKLFVCVARLRQSYPNEPYQKLGMWAYYIFILLEIYILYRNVCILYRHRYIHVRYAHTLEVRMSTSGIVICYRGWGCQSPNPQEIHCFKWEAVPSTNLVEVSMIFPYLTRFNLSLQRLRQKISASALSVPSSHGLPLWLFFLTLWLQETVRPICCRPDPQFRPICCRPDPQFKRSMVTKHYCVAMMQNYVPSTNIIAVDKYIGHHHKFYAQRQRKSSSRGEIQIAS
jgi:hypothetical protein